MTSQSIIPSTPKGLLIMIYAPFGFCTEAEEGSSLGISRSHKKGKGYLLKVEAICPSKLSHEIKSPWRKLKNTNTFFSQVSNWGKHFANFWCITKSCKIHVFQIFQNILYWSSKSFEGWRIHHFWWGKKKVKCINNFLKYKAENTNSRK